MTRRAGRSAIFSFLSLCPMLPLLTACRVEAHKAADRGKGDDVKIATPFGHMQVNTNHADVQDSLGLSVYPGAVAEQRENGNDSQADINFSFGRFKLRVKAMSFLTPDPIDKVEAFYRKDLAKYGSVIECADNAAVGTPVRTSEGLTCDEDKGRSAMHGNVSASLELKTGSKQHQHVVGLERRGDQTKIGLVALDLPGEHFGSGAEDKGHEGDARQ